MKIGDFVRDLRTGDAYVVTDMDSYSLWIRELKEDDTPRYKETQIQRRIGHAAFDGDRPAFAVDYEASYMDGAYRKIEKILADAQKESIAPGEDLRKLVLDVWNILEPAIYKEMGRRRIWKSNAESTR